MKYFRMLSAALIVIGLALIYRGGALNLSAALAGANQLTQEEEIAQAVASGDLLRLHIIADSDLDEAQRIKLRVRDAFVARYSDKLRAAGSPAEAENFVRAHLDEIEEMAQSVLKSQGADYGAHAELGVYDFPDRQYGSVVVPAGRYRALKITLGSGSGRNWWCVIYPALCALPPDVPQEDGQVVLHSAIWDWLSTALGLDGAAQ